MTLVVSRGWSSSSGWPQWSLGNFSRVEEVCKIRFDDSGVGGCGWDIFLGIKVEVYVERKVIVQSCSETTMMKWMELNSGWSQSRGAADRLWVWNLPSTHGVNPWKPVASHTVFIFLEEGLLCDQGVYITQWLSGLGLLPAGLEFDLWYPSTSPLVKCNI